jgi:hypothetical protein
VVVNDLGGSMGGHGADSSVADSVVREIESAGGLAIASHDSVASPQGADAIVRTALERYGRLDAVVRQGEAHPFLQAIRPELVVPIVVYLASRDCQVTHHNYSACAGRYARVFVGLAEGWLAESNSRPTADDVAERFDKISEPHPFSIPDSIFDEIAEICGRLNLALE